MDQYDIYEPVVSVVTGVKFPVVAELNNPPCLSLSLSGSLLYRVRS